MAQETNIGWTDLSWNPTHGCSIVSTECRNCYAMTLSLRYGQTSKPWTPANAAENVLLKPHKLREPLSGAAEWKGLGDAARAAGKTEGKLVFVNSMSDLFHEQVPMWYIARVFAVMALAPQHTFQILTKRPERMRDVLGWGEWPDNVHAQARQMLADTTLRMPHWASARVEAWDGFLEWPLPNVWLGVSVGSRQFVSRADLLRQTPAAVRFISAEPLIGPLLYDGEVDDLAAETTVRGWSDGRDADELSLTGIDWLIAGGESGPGHRPMALEWVRDLRAYCQHTRHLYDPNTERRGPGTAFFLKQLGGARPDTPLEQIPEDLRFREFPVLRAYPRAARTR